MAWIELHQAVWTHRKTFLLADALQLDQTYAAAHVIRLWTWALDNVPGGDCSALTERAIAYGADWRGDAPAFVAALIHAGWLDADADGGLWLHDWQDYAGRLIERRMQNAERMRDARAQRAPSIKETRAQNVQSTCDARAGATVPNRTGPNRTGPDTTGERAAAADATTRAVEPPREEITQTDEPLEVVRSRKRMLPAARVLPAERIDELAAEFGPRLGGAHRARDAIAKALNHKSRRRYDDLEQYLRIWLTEDAARSEREEVTSDGATGERPDGHSPFGSEYDILAKLG